MGTDDVHGMGGFPATRHTVIERIRDADADARRTAYGDLVSAYWKPVYKHLRVTWRLDAEEARDLTQAFFAHAFQKAWLERYEPGKAKFRTFVRVCADRFAINERQSRARLKRGGGLEMVGLDFDAADRELANVRGTPEGPEEYFHQEFVRALFERALDAVRAEFDASDRALYYRLFERYDVAPGPDVSYGQLAAEFGLSVTQVTNYLAQVRRAFRARALEALAAACGSDEEFRREAREIFGIEVP